MNNVHTGVDFTHKNNVHTGLDFTHMNNVHTGLDYTHMNNVHTGLDYRWCCGRRSMDLEDLAQSGNYSSGEILAMLKDIGR